MKRFFSLFLAFLLCTSTICSSYALTYGGDIAPEEDSHTQIFSDVPEEHWAFQYISELVARGAISGFPDGKYYPNAVVTRAQFATIMVKAANVTPTAVSSTGFTDVPGTHWSAPFVAAVKPYMTAYQQSDGRLAFKPDQPALREDIAVAVVKMKGYDTSAADLGMLETLFSDYDSISAAIRPYIATAVEHGVISGYTDGTFRGQRSVTRAEAAAILWRAFQLGGDNKVLPGEGNSTQNTTQPNTAPDVNQNSESTASKPDANVVSTIESVPTGVDAYTFTQDGTMYYIKNNKLYKIEAGKTSELFDGDRDYYEEIATKDMIAELLDGPEAFYWDGITVFGADFSDDILYFDHLELKQLGYNQKDDAVYVYAESNMDSAALAYFDMALIFNAETPSAPVYTVRTATSDEYRPKRGMICGNGVLAYSDYTAGDWVINTRSGNATNYGRNVFDRDYAEYFSMGGTIYQFGGRWGQSLAKLDLNTNSWDSINLADDTMYGASSVSTNSGKIYFSNGDGIYSLENAGTNRMKSVQTLSWNDLKIQDGTPFGEVKAFLFDAQGNILFLDGSRHTLRKIAL